MYPLKYAQRFVYFTDTVVILQPPIPCATEETRKNMDSFITHMHNSENINDLKKYTINTKSYLYFG